MKFSPAHRETRRNLHGLWRSLTFEVDDDEVSVAVACERADS